MSRATVGGSSGMSRDVSGQGRGVVWDVPGCLRPGPGGGRRCPGMSRARARGSSGMSRHVSGQGPGVVGDVPACLGAAGRPSTRAAPRPPPTRDRVADPPVDDPPRLALDMGADRSTERRRARRGGGERCSGRGGMLFGIPCPAGTQSKVRGGHGARARCPDFAVGVGSRRLEPEARPTFDTHGTLLAERVNKFETSWWGVQ